MATKYLDVSSTKETWTTVAGIPVASGDILRVSGAYNPNRLVVLGLGGTTPTGKWTVSGGDYMNAKDYDSANFSGAIYKYILGLDGTKVSEYDNAVEVTATTSGTFFAFYV